MSTKRWLAVLAASAGALALPAGALAADSQRVPRNCQTEGDTAITCTGAYGQSVTLSKFQGLADGDTIDVTVRNFATGMTSGAAGFTDGPMSGYYAASGPKAFTEADADAAASAEGLTFPLTLDSRFTQPLERQTFVNVGDRDAGARAQDPRLLAAAYYDNVLVPVYLTGQVDHGDIDPQIDAKYLDLEHPALTAPNGNLLTTAGFAPGETVSYTLHGADGYDAYVRGADREYRTIGQIGYDPEDAYTATQAFYVPDLAGTYTLTATGQTSGVVRTTKLEVLDPGVTADVSARTVTDPRSGLTVTVSKTRGLDPSGERVLVTYTNNPTNAYGVQQPVLPVHALAPSLDDGYWAASSLLDADVNQLHDVNFEGSYVVELTGTVPEGRFLAGSQRYGELHEVDASTTQSYLAFTNVLIPEVLVPIRFAGSALPAQGTDQRELFARVTPGRLVAGDRVKLSSWFFRTASGEAVSFATDIPGLTIPSTSLGVPAYGESGRLLEQTFRIPAGTAPGTYTVTATGATSGLTQPFSVTVSSPVAPPAGGGGGGGGGGGSAAPTEPVAPGTAATITAPSVSVDSSTRVVLSAAQARYGSAQTAQVEVRQADGTPAAGSVVVKVDGRAATTGTLDASGRVRVALPRDLHVGARTVTAAYAGSVGVGASEATARLQVVRAASRLTVSVRDGVARVRVAVVGAPASVSATGRIVVRAGGRELAATALRAGSGGRAALWLSGVDAGSRLSAVYGGSKDVRAATASATR